MNIKAGFQTLTHRAYVAFFAAAFLLSATAGTAHAVTVPVAIDDSYSIAEDNTLIVDALTGVVVNDTDDDVGPITAVLDTDVSNGTLSLSSDGSFTYAPDLNFEGSDSFTYFARDAVDGDSVTAATVTITVTAVNDTPNAVNDAYSVDANSTLTVLVGTGVLDNDSDVDTGDTLDAVDNSAGVSAQGGAYNLNINGSFVYIPFADFVGLDSFTYKADDGTAQSTVATVEITVNQRPQTITFGALPDQTYGDSTSLDLSATSDSGLTVTFDAVGDCSMVDADTVGFSDAGTCTVTASQAGNALYDAAPDVDQVLTINPRAITLTAVTDSKVYDTNTSSVGVPSITSGTLALAESGATFSQEYLSSDVASGIVIEASSSLDADPNYDITYVDATGDITPVTLTVSATASNKVYDSFTTASVVLTVTPLGSDSVTTTYTSADFDTKDVGTGKFVTVLGIALTGADAGNYVLGSASAVTTADIEQAALSAEVTVADKVYDNTTTGVITLITPVGLVGGETVTINGGAAAFDTEHVGVGKTVTVTGLNLVADAVSANYLFTDTDSTTASITARPITVTAQSNAKVYDGLTTSVTLPTVTSGTIVSPDTAEFTQTYDTANVGTGKTLTASGVVNDGNNGDNYQVTFVASAAGSISQAPLTITADDLTKVYGDANPTATATYTGFVNGETSSVLDTAVTLVIVANTQSDVNDYVVTAFGAADSNYSITHVNGNLSVTARSLTVTVTASDKVYDSSTAASVSLAPVGVLFTDVVTASHTGATFDTKDVGTNKTVTVSGITLLGADATNYSVATTATGDADITVLPIGITADAKTKVYGAADPSLTYQITTGALAGSDSLSGALSRASGEDVATYAIGQGTLSAGSNYDLTFTGADFTITRAVLTITADDKSKTYGDVNPALTVSYSGFMNGDDENDLTTEADASTVAVTGSDAGTYDITPANAADDNYTFSYVNGTLTIAKADQTITFGSLSDMNHGDPDFSVSATADSSLDVSFVGSGACSVVADSVHLTTKGTCTVTASQAGDTNWNAAPDVAQSFTVTDVTAPVITRTGDASVTADLQSTYTDQGATATDAVDGAVLVTVTNPVNPNVEGTYTVTYNATDAEGNAATPVTRTVTVVAASTSGGGGGGSSRRSPTGTVSSNDSGRGQVLGAASYNFAADMTIGSTGQDVLELQKTLISLGFLQIAAPTEYYGPMTAAAVKLYQTAHGIPATGFVGPLTRAALNAEVTTTTTPGQQLASLLAQLKVLQEKLKQMTGN